MYKYLFLVLIFILSGCSTSKEMVQKQEVKPAEYNQIMSKPKEAIKYVKIGASSLKVDYKATKDKTNIEKIKIFGASFYDTLMLLMEATGENIIVEQQSESIENNLAFKKDFPVYLSTENISFKNLLQKLADNRLSVSYEDGIYYLNSVKKVNIKIPPIKDLSANIQKALASFGATNIMYDNITSSLSFVAKQKDYEAIVKYINNLKSNLYVIEYEIAIYSVTLNENYGLGIDWELLQSRGSVDYSFSSKNALTGVDSLSPFQFGILKNSSTLSMSALINMLETFGKVESIQRPTLMGLAGTTVKLKDGVEESYISEISKTVSTTGTTTSTTTESVLSGIDIELNANLLDGTVITEIKLNINNVVGYSEFSTTDGTYKQPKTVTQEIENTIRVRAGEPILISGLFRDSKTRNFRGLPNTSDTPFALFGGAKSDSLEKSEIVVIVTPRVIKYVME